MRDSRERRDDRKIRPIRRRSWLIPRPCRWTATARAMEHRTVSMRELTLTRDQLSPRTPMSALPPKADMDQSGCDVRFVPKADIRLSARPRSVQLIVQPDAHDVVGLPSRAVGVTSSGYL